MSAADLDHVKIEFVEVVDRAARIGFDLAELHAGHGYLLHQFLSPLSNRRDDNYGGSLENRMRYPLEVFEAVRRAWPDERPLGVRVSALDWVDGGLTIEEVIQFCRELKGRGCDFADITSGGLHPDQKIAVGPGYQVPLAARIRKDADIPVMAVGMINDAQQAENIVESGQADMIAMARGMMWDPRWAWHAAEALGADTPYSEMYERCHPSRWPQAFEKRRG
jgi:2,4-dienoyl-CoA reductase-like NADH-dependent reductase (Old Yellow Enzyme family)